ncbi:MAG: glycosyltransferase [Desulfobacterales bacterium]
MKICMFTNTYLPHVGGVANSVSTFASDLLDLGHQVLVVAPEFEGSNNHDSEDRHVLRLPAIQNFNGSDFSVNLPLPFLISERMESFQPEVIHSHHPYLLGNAGLRTAKQRGIPIVFTHHTLYERYTHYVSENSEVLKRFALRLSTEYANLCTRVVAPSQSVADLITRRGVSRPIDVIPTGVDLPFFGDGQGRGFRKRYGIPADALVIGHVGRLAPEKNLAYLAEAATHILEKRKSACFLVIGSGPSENAIRDIFNKRGLEDRLFAVGKLSGEPLRDGYHAMDLFVFSSQSETQGMVLTEAMAAGLAVVALDGPGVREVVQDGFNGRLMPADTPPEAFAKAADAWLQTGTTDDAMTQRIRSSVEPFDRRICAARMATLYEEAVEQHRSTQPRSKETGPFDRLLERIKAEWDLIDGAISAAVDTVMEKRNE